MRLIARPIDAWPGEPTDYRQASPFTATWADTSDLLAREVEMLTPKGSDAEVVLQLAVGERDIRRDGWIRADSRPAHPGVIVSFQSRYGPLRYHTDRFSQRGISGYLNGWKANVRAIALGLESLRRVDRYGIASDGQQYRGWQALAAGAAPDGPMSVEEAARFMAEHAWGPDIDPQEAIDDPDAAYRTAAKRLHPDHGGDPADFLRLKQARDLLEHA